MCGAAGIGDASVPATPSSSQIPHIRWCTALIEGCTAVCSGIHFSMIAFRRSNVTVAGNGDYYVDEKKKEKKGVTLNNIHHQDSIAAAIQEMEL